MSKKIFPLIGLIVLGALLLSSCAGSALGAGQSWSNVTANQETGVVYLSAGSLIYAVDAKTGSLVWTAPEKPNARTTFYAPGLVVEKQLIVGDFKSAVHSFSTVDGSEGWIFEDARDRFIGGAAYANDLIFVPSADYSVYALNLQGDLVYTFETGQVNWSTPVTDEDNVYFSSMDHHLYAYDLSNGELVWKTDMGGAINGSPALGDGMLYVGTLNREVIAVNASDGSIEWRSGADDYLWATPLAHDGIVYIGDALGEIHAYDAATGDLSWTAAAGSPVTAKLTVVGDNLVAVTRALDVVAFSFDGEKVWTRSVTDSTGVLQSDPVLVGDLLIIPVSAGSDTLMVAFDAAGNEVWSFLPAE